MRSDGAIVCFGELLLRLSAPGAELLFQSPVLKTHWGGAEANVAISLAQFGHAARMVSAVPDNAIGRAACEELRRRGVEVSHIVTRPGRMGLYFLSPSAGLRRAEVIYDRAGSAFALTDFATWEWDTAFAGAGWLHVSGVTAALGERPAAGAVEAARRARRSGLTVSFDCNYRASLWAQWNGDAKAIFADLLCESDIAFAGSHDIGVALGRNFATGQEAAAAAFAAFPNLSLLTWTRRDQQSADIHELSAQMCSRRGSFSAPPLTIANVTDRIGAGDAFAAGLIHGFRKGWSEDQILRFALAAAALKHAVPGDANLVREEDVLAAMQGEFGVRR